MSPEVGIGIATALLVLSVVSLVWINFALTARNNRQSEMLITAIQKYQRERIEWNWPRPPETTMIDLSRYNLSHVMAYLYGIKQWANL